MQKIIIEHASDAGQRIDRFCKKYFPNIALGGIYRLLRTGKIKVNGKKKDQTYKLEQGDEISLWMSDDEISLLRIESVSHKQGLSGGIIDRKTPNLDILYEDQYLMVVNKPAGLNVHAGDHKTDESNLIDQVHDYLGNRHNSLTFRPALVHRIDRDTSGCILIAKEKSVLESLLEDLQSHKIEKVYHALTLGRPDTVTGTIRDRLLRIENARGEAKVRVDSTGQSAVTHYKIIKNGFFHDKDSYGIILSLVECRIETGRTHQIRVHLAHIGCPILGDKAYGNKKMNSLFARSYGIDRQMLHAYSLEFTHPITKKHLKVEAPYYPDFIRAIDIIDTQKS